MESNPREPLLGGIGKNPRTDKCSGADISETTHASPRRAPPPPPPPPPPPRHSLLGLRNAKNPRTDECSGSNADSSETTPTSPRRAPPPPPPPRHSLLGLRNAKSPRTDECSGSGADSSETTPTSPRRSPPPPSPPLRSLLGLGSAKSQGIFFSSSPSLPSLPAHGIPMNQPASFSPPSLPRVFDPDPEALPCRTPQQLPSSASSSRGGTSKNSDGAKISSPVSTPTPPSGREGLAFKASSSPSSGAWWNLFGRLRRRAPPHLPLSAPRGSGPFDGFRKSIKELRQKGAHLDLVGVERVIGIFGFSLFGSLSLFPYTMDRIKDFITLDKSMVMFTFGLIWVLASVGVLSGLLGKTDFEQAFCRSTGRLGVVGLAFLVIFHVWWTLPSDNNYCTAGFYVLLALAFLLHILSWGMSLLVGEDRIEEASDAQD